MYRLCQVLGDDAKSADGCRLREPEGRSRLQSRSCRWGRRLTCKGKKSVFNLPAMAIIALTFEFVLNLILCMSLRCKKLCFLNLK